MERPTRCLMYSFAHGPCPTREFAIGGLLGVVKVLSAVVWEG